MDIEKPTRVLYEHPRCRIPTPRKSVSRTGVACGEIVETGDASVVVVDSKRNVMRGVNIVKLSAIAADSVFPIAEHCDLSGRQKSSINS
jgi:hypothetical protein